MNYKLIGDNNYLGDLQEEFFKNRGIEDIHNFKNLHSFKPTDPCRFKNMDRAIECFDSHADTSTIGIVVDEDADGITSASMLYQFISTNFENKIIPIIHEKNKYHGIAIKEIEPYMKEIKLLIVPDAGSSDFEEHEYLKSKGIDIIVIDHHKPDKESVNAIIVNNQLSNISVNLTGVAMTYKFIEVLADQYGLENVDRYLDLVMMGLIGDSADTKDLEVQYYIQQGIRKIHNPMINALIEKESFSLKGEINQESFGWYLCPDVNAVIRLGSYEQKKLLFEAFAQIDTKRIFKYEPSRGKNKGKVIEENLFEHCARFCVSLKAKQQREIKKIIEGNTRVKGLSEYIEDDDNKKVLLVDATNFLEDGELIGLLANKLMGKYKKPVIALRKCEDGLYGGSGRGEQIFNFKTKLNKSNLLNGEGHEPAFGVQKVNIDDIKKIEADINTYFKEEIIKTYHIVDFIVPFEEFEDYMIEDLYALRNYWGQGMDSPLIYIKNIKVPTNTIKTNDKKTTMFFEANFIKYVKFNINEEYFDSMVSWADDMYYNIIGKPTINERDGERYVQIQITDMEVLNLEDNIEDNWDDDDWEDTDEQNVEW